MVLAPLTHVACLELVCYAHRLQSIHDDIKDCGSPRLATNLRPWPDAPNLFLDQHFRNCAERFDTHNRPYHKYRRLSTH